MHAAHSPQGNSPQGQFTAEAIHRRGNSPQGNSPQEQFTANNSPQKKIKSRAIHRRASSPQGNSPQGQFTAEAIPRKAIYRKNNSPQKIHRKQFTNKNSTKNLQDLKFQLSSF
jgi:hypothetical protein